MRDINQLTPIMKARIQLLQAECKRQGVPIKIADCLRTQAEQDAIPKEYTHVKYPDSNHNWGIAADIYRADGKGNGYYDGDGFFGRVGIIGKSLGLSWGGDWKSFQDKPHFEYLGYGTHKMLEDKYGTPATFLDQFGINIYPKPAMITITAKSPKASIMWLQSQLNIMIMHQVNYLKVDGDYGPKTIEAVRIWYRMNCWKSKGLFIGPIALAKLA